LRFLDGSEQLPSDESGSFGSLGYEEARTIVVTRKALRLLVRALSHMQGIDGCSVDVCRGPTLGAIVTCRRLVLLNWSGSNRKCSIIISYRGDLDSTGSCSQAIRLFTTVQGQIPRDGS